MPSAPSAERDRLDSWNNGSCAAAAPPALFIMAAILARVAKRALNRASVQSLK
jgi:hypothetical protein